MNAFWVINQQKISIVLVLPTQKLHHGIFQARHFSLGALAKSAVNPRPMRGCRKSSCYPLRSVFFLLNVDLL